MACGPEGVREGWRCGRGERPQDRGSGSVRRLWKELAATGPRRRMTLLERLGEAVEEVVESAIRAAPFRDLVDRMEYGRVVLPTERMPDLLE